MCALAGRSNAAAYFISPIVDLEYINGVTLDEEHLRYVRQRPIEWRGPTHILYGENDSLTSLATISDFARRTGASLEVMPGGEHWFPPQSRWRFWTGGLKSPKCHYFGMAFPSGSYKAINFIIRNTVQNLLRIKKNNIFD